MIPPLLPAVLLLVVFLWAPVHGHHPGQDLDDVMGSREQFFEAVDRPAPDFDLRDGAGRAVRLASMRDKVVVLNFVYTSCPDICPLHAERIAEIQQLVSQTPMRDLVVFLTITTAPLNDTADVISEYGPEHGLDAANWLFLTTRSDQSEDATRRLAAQFGHTFTTTEDGYQAHGIVTHVIDRGGRWAANFHGLRFAPVNVVLYVNGLINRHEPTPPAEPNIWQRMRDLI